MKWRRFQLSASICPFSLAHQQIATLTKQAQQARSTAIEQARQVGELDTRPERTQDQWPADTDREPIRANLVGNGVGCELRSFARFPEEYVPMRNPPMQIAYSL